jgi:DNA-binding LytR/AlgR family response regulator
MRILIVDDEPTTGFFLESIIKEVPGVITDVVTNGKEALESAAISEPQAVFLDIDMPDMNGIELAHILAKKYEHLSLVFATAHPGYALEAFELYSVDYILKPYDEERIKKTESKLADKSNLGQSEAAIPIKTNKQMVFIKPSHILYIETRDNGNIIKTLNRTYTTREDMHDFEVSLQQYYFFRCNRSYLVNLKHVKGIVSSGRTYQIILDTEDKILLSRKQASLLRIKLQQQQEILQNDN